MQEDFERIFIVPISISKLLKPIWYYMYKEA